MTPIITEQRPREIFNWWLRGEVSAPIQAIVSLTLFQELDVKLNDKLALGAKKWNEKDL